MKYTLVIGFHSVNSQEVEIVKTGENPWTHRLFDNYWEAYAYKVMINQGLMDPMLRFSDRWLGDYKGEDN